MLLLLCAVNPRVYWGYVCLLFPVTDFCFFTNVGVGSYTYLLEPLWWAGMVTSKYSNSDPTLSSLSLSPLRKVKLYKIKEEKKRQPKGADDLFLLHTFIARIKGENGNDIQCFSFPEFLLNIWMWYLHLDMVI